MVVVVDRAALVVVRGVVVVVDDVVDVDLGGDDVVVVSGSDGTGSGCVVEAGTVVRGDRGTELVVVTITTGEGPFDVGLVDAGSGRTTI